MKNIFKLMGIALLSCSLMVACGDDDTDNPTPVDPTPGPTPTEGSYTLKIDNGASNWAYVKAVHFTNNQAWGFSAAGSYENNQVGLPYFVTYLFETNNQGQDILALCDFFDGDNVPTTELYFEEILEDGDGEQFGDYMLWDIPSYDFGTFDATTHTTTFNYNIEFINYMEFYSNFQGMYPGDEAWANMTAEQRAAIYQQCAEGVTRKNVQFATNNYVFQAQ